MSKAALRQKQAKFWVKTPSYAFVRQPETNGVIERMFRTLKEQTIQQVEQIHWSSADGGVNGCVDASLN